jgi:hypothetical protein
MRKERKDMKRRKPSPYILFFSGVISHPSSPSTNSAPNGYLLTPVLIPYLLSPFSYPREEGVWHKSNTYCTALMIGVRHVIYSRLYDFLAQPCSLSGDRSSLFNFLFQKKNNAGCITECFPFRVSPLLLSVYSSKALCSTLP